MSIFRHLGRKHHEPDGKRSKKFTLHGAFKSKEEAVKREREVQGFILERNGRFYVMTENK